MKDFESTQEARETAALGATHYVFGEPLHPFSLSRQIALERAGFTSSETENYILLIYLCILDNDAIKKFLGGGTSVEDLRMAALEWAGERKVSIHCQTVDNVKVYASAETRQLAEKAETLWTEARASEFTVEASPGPASPNESRRGSRLTTKRKSRQ